MKELEPKAENVGTLMILKVGVDQLLYLLNHHIRTGHIPGDAKVTIHVPGGGDYSDTDIDLPEIQIRWIER